MSTDIFALLSLAITIAITINFYLRLTRKIRNEERFVEELKARLVALDRINSELNQTKTAVQNNEVMSIDELKRLVLQELNTMDNVDKDAIRSNLNKTPLGQLNYIKRLVSSAKGN